MNPPFIEGARRDADAGLGLIGAVVALMVFLFVLYFLFVSTVLFAGAALLTAVAAWAATRVFGEDIGFLGTLGISCIGLFLYLAFTGAAGFFAGFVLPDAQGFLAEWGRAIFTLKQQTFAGLASARTGAVDWTRFFATGGHLTGRLDATPMGIAAFAALHGGGWLMYGITLTRYLGRPFDGIRGGLLACAMVLVTLPASAAALLWLVAMYFKGAATG